MSILVILVVLTWLGNGCEAAPSKLNPELVMKTQAVVDKLEKSIADKTPSELTFTDLIEARKEFVLWSADTKKIVDSSYPLLKLVTALTPGLELGKDDEIDRTNSSYPTLHKDAMEIFEKLYKARRNDELAATIDKIEARKKGFAPFNILSLAKILRF